MWKITKQVVGFSFDRAYKMVLENSLNVALVSDDGTVQYVDKKFLVNVGGVYA